MGSQTTAAKLMAPTRAFWRGWGLFVVPRSTTVPPRNAIGGNKMLASFILLIGSGIGGVARHLFNGWPMKAVGTEFPLGILAINFIGSSAMGLVADWLPSRGTLHRRCGCYSQPAYSGGSTTFSAFSLDAALLYERGQPWLAAIYALASVKLLAACICESGHACRVTYLCR